MTIRISLKKTKKKHVFCIEKCAQRHLEWRTANGDTNDIIQQKPTVVGCGMTICYLLAQEKEIAYVLHI